MYKKQTIVACTTLGLLMYTPTVFSETSHETKGSVSRVNTELNVRDRSDSAVLPQDQSNSQEHINRTAAIRKELTQSDTLSTTAKNVKIITLENGKVILRGPVNSQAEKTQVEEAARRQSGGAPVESFLEIAK